MFVCDIVCSPHCYYFFLMVPRPPTSTLFPYTTLFRSPRTVAAIKILPNQYTLPLMKGLSGAERSEEHTSELQSHSDLVCRLLLEKKKNQTLSEVSLKKLFGDRGSY